MYGEKRYMICYDKYPLGAYCHAKNDLKDGKWIFYYDSDITKVAYIYYYKDGKQAGIFFWYRDNESNL